MTNPEYRVPSDVLARDAAFAAGDEARWRQLRAAELARAEVRLDDALREMIAVTARVRELSNTAAGLRRLLTAQERSGGGE